MKHIKRFEDHINEASEDLVTLNVTISNIDQSTAKDFLKMFALLNNFI
jgi:predicted amino acid-binding ACT domain protein